MYLIFMIDVEQTRLLLKQLEALCKHIAQGQYESSDVRKLFSIMSENRFPKELVQLAEAFGMMMVKVEAREYHLESVISELEETRKRLEVYSLDLEHMVSERTEELSRANSELSRLANLDGLTRISNRRLFDRYLASEWRKSIAENTPLALTLADVDMFKMFNDTYGHIRGDECLISIAAAFRSVYGLPRYLVSRYGGEEFAIIQPNTPAEDAMELADKARRAIEGLGIMHENNPNSPHVTISLGVACAIPTGKLTSVKLIEMADEALYAAKGKGRNACILFDSGE